MALLACVGGLKVFAFVRVLVVSCYPSCLRLLPTHRVCPQQHCIADLELHNQLASVTEVTQVHISGWLQVYDTKTMSSVPVAKVAMPQRVPMGFHGLFVHQEQLKMQAA